MTKLTQSTPFSAEDRRHLDDLRRGFEHDYSPRTTADRVLLNELIGAAQCLFHLNRLEAEHCATTPDLDTLGTLSRQRTAAQTTFHQSLKLLEGCKAPARAAKVQSASEPAPSADNTIEPNPVPVLEICTNKPNPAPVPNEPNPADIPAHRSLEQHIIEHGRAAAFREDEEETGYSDDLLELCFQLQAKLPVKTLQSHIATLTGEAT